MGRRGRKGAVWGHTGPSGPYRGHRGQVNFSPSRIVNTFKSKKGQNSFFSIRIIIKFIILQLCVINELIWPIFFLLLKKSYYFLFLIIFGKKTCFYCKPGKNYQIYLFNAFNKGLNTSLFLINFCLRSLFLSLNWNQLLIF